MSDVTETIYSHARDSAQRFEYFLLGISVGLCAFVGQTVKPERFGLSPYTFQIAFLIVLIVSVVAGFRRVELMIATAGINHEIVVLQGRMARFVKREPTVDVNTGELATDWAMDFQIGEIRKQLPTWEKRLHQILASEPRWYLCQKWCLAIGFTGLIVARSLSAYFPTSVSP